MIDGVDSDVVTDGGVRRPVPRISPISPDLLLLLVSYVVVLSV